MSRLFVFLFPLLLGQPTPPDPSTWTIAVDPSSPAASSVHWTLALSAAYCGGFALGDGVYIQPEAPLSLPDPVPSADVLFDGESASAFVQNGVLRVVPSPDRMWSQVCIQGDRPFTVELLPALGLTSPDAGTYTVDVWIDSASAPAQLPIIIN